MLLLPKFHARSFRKSSPHFAAMVLPLLLAGLTHFSAANLPGPPPTRRDNVKETVQGVEIVDPYRWLEDQQSPETRAWIDAQNRYTRSMLDPWPGRQALRRRLSELMRVDTISLPVMRHGRYFFKKRPADLDQGMLCMRQGSEGKDEVLIDPNPLSPDHATGVNLAGVSEDGTLMAFAARHAGEDETSIRFLNVDTRTELPDQLPKGRYFSTSIKPDKSGLFYSRHEEDGPRVYYHAFGAPPAADQPIFGQGYGTDIIIGCSLSEDGHYLLVSIAHGSAADITEIYYQDLASGAPLKPLITDIPARFEGEFGGDTLFLHTNWKAPNGRILAVDLEHPEREHWREIVPEGNSAIEMMSLAGGQLIVNYIQNASSQVEFYNAAGKRQRDLPLPALGSLGGVSSRWSTPEVFYGFDSFAIPFTIYRYDASTGAQKEWARLNVPIQSNEFETKQVWYESKDKTRAPMFLLYRRGLKPDGARPTLLTAYGGFNVSLTPSFSEMAAVWAEQGGVFAMPNLRGGGEFGEAWHKAGMLGEKQNVFDDFIAAAQWLIHNGYTDSTHLAIAGGSNGGLLVGAALTQRPDLFRAVYCGYPLLDMIRYQKFLVARYWVSEYGSSEDPAQFKYLYAYSPYHHVTPGTQYPAVLLASGDSDTRVAPLHARKMTALLQASTGSTYPVLLRYDTEAGHSSGGMPTSKRIDQTADELSFLFWQLGVNFTP